MKRILPALAIAAALLFAPTSALAADSTTAPASASLVKGIDEDQATAIADRDPNVVKEGEEHADLTSSAKREDGSWQVAYFGDDKEVALVYVDPHSGEVTESWTGDQVAWKMARGYSGQFGHKLNAPYVFLPICLFFLVGLFDWKRWRRVANLDLVVLLGFGVSHYFFNQGEIGVSVPLAYPVLLYLLGRALWIGFHGRGLGLRPVWATSWLVVAALFLMGVRVGLNMADAGSTDIGYAGIVGADRIAHGEPIYGNFPDGISDGDTYGPVNYFAYVPFERIWPWTGEWDDLPGSHAAAVTFDLLTFGFLILLGIRIRPGPRGKRLAAILAFGWASYPYTAMVLESNSNDGLVALLMVAILLALSRPVARGALAALATFAKFAPAVLVPMLATYRAPAAGPVTPGGIGRRHFVGFALSFVAVSVAVMLWPAIDPGLRTFYDRTFGFQVDRDSPFSIWGQVPSLTWLHDLVLVAVAGLSLFLAFRPRRKSLVQIAALSAALMIGLELTLHHWFYLYIVWFYPLLLVALACLGPEGDGGGEEAPTAERQVPGPSPARSSRPVPAG